MCGVHIHLHTLSVCRVPERMFVSPMTYTRSALSCTEAAANVNCICLLVIPISDTGWRCVFYRQTASSSITLTHCTHLQLATSVHYLYLSGEHLFCAFQA